MGIGLYCTDCNREFEEYEDVITIESGCVEPLILDGEFGVTMGQCASIRTLCKSCGSALLEKPQPNRVALILEQVASKTTTVEVLSERPEELVLIINQEPFGTLVFGGPHGRPIGKLNTVKEEA